MIPDSSQNIYPNNEENVRAILNFYFQIPDGDLKSIFEQKKLTMNQLEFIAEQVSKNLYYLEGEIGKKDLTISNAMHYGIDALSVNEKNWSGSKNRNSITKKLRTLIIENQNVKAQDN